MVRLAAVAAVALSSGFPFGFFYDLVPVYLRTRGVDLAAIGLVWALSLPWALKFLWAPLVDRVGNRRQWIAGCQIALAAVLAAMVLGGADSGSLSATYVGLLFLLVFLSATQDIAVDAYTIELVEPHELGPANGVRVTAYRIGMIVAGGALVAASAALGWPAVFAIAGVLFVGLALLTTRLPRRREVSAAHTPVLEPLRDLLQRPAIVGVIFFVLTFKLGDLALTPMVKPFWIDSGYSVEQIGLIQTTLGVGASIVGALVGGFATERMGLYRGLWVLGLVQALSNLGYWAAARTGAPVPLMYTVALVEQFTYGLGTAAFLAFLMALCTRQHAATQFALLSALFRVGGIAAATVSGFLTERLGYASYFLVTFALAFPGFAFLVFVRHTLTFRAEAAAEG